MDREIEGIGRQRRILYLGEKVYVRAEEDVDRLEEPTLTIQSLRLKFQICT